MTDILDLTRHSYCKTAYASSADELIANAEMQLLGQKIDFDSMVGIGSSGLLVLPVLARHFNVPFFAMRKPGMLSHNTIQPSGDGRIGKKWILIDDVTVTGGTIKYVKNRIKALTQENSFHTTFIGSYFYEPMSKVPGEFIYPIGHRRSVQSVQTALGVVHVDYGLYAKAKEIIEVYPDLSKADVMAKIMQRCSGWDTTVIATVINSLIK